MANNGQTAAGIADVLGFGMELIIGEHFYSASLSSPFTTQIMTAGDPEKEAIVWKLYVEATIGTIGLAILFGWLLRGKKSYNWYPLLAATIISAYYGYTYWRALNGKL